MSTTSESRRPRITASTAFMSSAMGAISSGRFKTYPAHYKSSRPVARWSTGAGLPRRNPGSGELYGYASPLAAPVAAPAALQAAFAQACVKRAHAEGPGRDAIAQAHAVDQRPQARRGNAHHVALAMREAAALPGAVLRGREHGAQEQHEAVGILVE